MRGHDHVIIEGECTLSSCGEESVIPICTVRIGAIGGKSKFDHLIVESLLQATLESIDTSLREKFSMRTEQTAVGLLDLNTCCLAMIHPDREEYGASVPKVGILLAYFQLHPEAATSLDPTTQHELGLMAKASNNEMASKFSHELGLKNIQKVLDEERRASRMILQVHDELVFEVPEGELEWAKVEVPRAMASVAELRVPLLAEVGVGRNWDEAH